MIEKYPYPQFGKVDSLTPFAWTECTEGTQIALVSPYDYYIESLRS